MRKSGFTLAELLIALAILGIIATFTIPKVLQSQQDSKWKSMAKEAAAIIAEGHSVAKQKNIVLTKPSDIMPYINYVRRDTVSTLDKAPSDPDYDCTDPNNKCLVLHNGGTLILFDAWPFFGNTNLDIIWFVFDPDGVRTSNANKLSLAFALYYNGRVASWATLAPSSRDGGGALFNPDPTKDPSWFSWN